jgi:hypothetical protein
MMQPGETMKIDKRIGALLPSLKAVGAALALACAGQVSVAAVATANLGGFGHASAVVTGGGVINFVDRFQSYSTSATNGLVTQSSAPFSFDWGAAALLSQANPGGNVAHAGNVNGVGGLDDPFNPIDSTGVFADATTSWASGLFTRASGSASKEGLFNLVSPLDLITPVAGSIDFIFDYSLFASTAAGGPDSAEAFVLLTFSNRPTGSLSYLLRAAPRRGNADRHVQVPPGPRRWRRRLREHVGGRDGHFADSRAVDAASSSARGCSGSPWFAAAADAGRCRTGLASETPH